MIVSEATWTAPRADCPNPGHWHSTDNQSTEIEVTELVAAFVRALQPEFVLETGSCIGQTSHAIGLALRENGHGRLVTLETDHERAAVARRRCTGLPVRVLEMPSLEFEPLEPIGFAWFDSLIELRVPEFERFRPNLVDGAVVGFHDTGPHFGSYGDTIDAIDGLSTMRLRTPRGVTFAQVRS